MQRWRRLTPRRIEKVIKLSDLFMALWLIQYAQLWFSGWAAGSAENTEVTWLVVWGGIQPVKKLNSNFTVARSGIATTQTYDSWLLWKQKVHCGWFYRKFYLCIYFAILFFKTTVPKANYVTKTMQHFPLKKDNIKNCIVVYNSA